MSRIDITLKQRLSEGRKALIPYVMSGFPQADATSWLGLAVSSRTPAETVARLNDSVSKALGTPEMRKQLVDTRALVITNLGPAAFAEEITRKFRQAAEAVRISGAKED